MPMMKNKWGDEVNIPDNQVQTAINSGYTHLNAAPQPTPQPTTTVLNQQTGMLEKVPVQQQAPQQSSDPDVQRLENGEVIRAGGDWTKLAQIQALGYIVEPIIGSSQGGIAIRKSTTPPPSFVNPTGEQAKLWVKQSDGSFKSAQDTSQSSQQTQLPQTGQNYTPEEIKKATLDAIAEYAAANPPKVTSQLSQGELDLYLKQAQERVNPEYAQYFEQARQDVLSGFQQLGQDLQVSERKLQSGFGSQLERTQENMASRGLTFSSIRDKAERTLQESTQAAIDAGRREAERRALDLGTAAERKLGSANLPTLPGVDEAPKPIIGTPGEFLFNKPTGTRSLYTPTGGQTGELAFKKIGATADLYNQYLQGEREQRGITKTA
mgnify:CR=1 FL=1